MRWGNADFGPILSYNSTGTPHSFPPACSCIHVSVAPVAKVHNGYFWLARYLCHPIGATIL